MPRIPARTDGRARPRGTLTSPSPELMHASTHPFCYSAEVSRAILPWETDDHRSVASRLAGDVARQIVEGSLGPGTLLTELEVAEKAGTSRTPVREALLQVEAWGLIQLLPKKGALVTTVSPKERRDLLDVRTTWEIRAVETMPDAPEARKALVARLRDCVDQQSAALESGDLLRFAARDFAFHILIIKAGGNSVITQLVDHLGPRFARLTYRVGTEHATSAHALRDEHHHLIELVATGDAAGFADAVRSHIEAAHFPTGA